MNIGLHISGPARLEEVKDKIVLENVKKRFPLVHSLYQHNFKYVTYSAISNGYAYVFDYEGYLIMKKEFNDSMFDEIKDKYSKAGYTLPKLIFWNVNSRTKTIPLTENELGVALISGFSQNVLKMVMSGHYDPYEILIETITDKRYDRIICE